MIQQFPFSSYIQPPPQAAETVQLPLGVNGQGVLETLPLTGDTPHHLLVTGFSGSGKSTFLHTLLGAVLTQHRPNQVQLWLTDNGKGEFSIPDLTGSPYIRHLHTDDTPGSAPAFIRALDGHIRQRLTQLSQASQALPRLLVIMDCCDWFLREIAEDSEILDTFCALLTQAAQAEVTFVLSAQSGEMLDSFTGPRWRVFDVRLAMPQSPAEGAWLLGSPAAGRLIQTLMLGQAVTNFPDVHKLNLLFLPPAEEADILRRAHRLGQIADLK